MDPLGVKLKEKMAHPLQTNGWRDPKKRIEHIGKRFSRSVSKKMAQLLGYQQNPGSPADY